MAGEGDYGGTNTDVDDQSNLSQDNNFGYDPSPIPQMPPEPEYTYADIERDRSDDGMSTFDRNQQRNEAAQEAAGEPGINSDGEEEGVASQFTQGDYLDLDSTTILEHKKKLSFEDPSAIEKAATGWNLLSIHLLAVADQMQTDATALANAWESDEAREMFLSRVGASTYSLREWAVLADNNFQANKGLHTAVKNGVEAMETLYTTFQGEFDGAVIAEDNMDYGYHTDGVLKEGTNGVGSAVRDRYFESTQCSGCNGYPLKSEYAGTGVVADVIRRYSERSRNGPMKTVDNGFTTAYMRADSGDQVWRGMQNAKTPDLQRFMQITGQLPTGPGGVPNPGGAPSPGAAPPMPPMPPMPNMPDLKNMLMMVDTGKALEDLKNLKALAERAAAQQRELDALQAMMNALMARQAAQALEQQLAQQQASTAQQAALAQAQAQAAQAAAAARQQIDTAGLQAAMDRAQAAAAQGFPGAPDMAVPAMGMPGFPGGLSGGIPGFPALSGPGSSGMGAPMMPPVGGRGGMSKPGMPALPGRGATAAPKSFQTKVNLPGRGSDLAGTAPSGRSGGAPGGGAGAKPSIGGRNAPTPTTAGPAAPSLGRTLGGRNADAARRLAAARAAGAKAPGTAPGVSAQGGLGGRSVPRPDRSENLTRARAAIRRSLQGRKAAETEESRRVAARRAAVDRVAREHSPYLKRREEQAQDSLAQIGLIDDHELFEVANAGNGVISRPESRGPVKKAGPALGAS